MENGLECWFTIALTKAQLQNLFLVNFNMLINFYLEPFWFLCF